jgi:putative restriction endonuclease
LFDKCLDKGFIAIDGDYNIHFSKTLKEKLSKKCFENTFKYLEGKKITLPEKFLPKKEFLDIQFKVFSKQDS